MAISTWEPSELDKQTQTAQQALARISELETEVTKYKWQRDLAAARWSYWVSLKDKNPLRAQKWNPEDIIKHLEYRWAERRTG
jgi:hypothetical protein